MTTKTSVSENPRKVERLRQFILLPSSNEFSGVGILFSLLGGTSAPNGAACVKDDRAFAIRAVAIRNAFKLVAVVSVNGNMIVFWRTP